MTAVHKQIMQGVSRSLGDLLVASEANEPAITWLFGAHDWNQVNFGPPAVGWVPTTDEPLPARQTQGVASTDSLYQADVLIEWQYNFDVHLWGSDEKSDMSQVEALRDNVVIAAHGYMSGFSSLAVGQTTWLPSSTGEKGRRGVLQLGMRVRTFDLASTLVTILTASTDVSASFGVTGSASLITDAEAVVRITSLSGAL